MTILRDPTSGLLNAEYFAVTVPARVAVARRALRPVSLVLLRTSGVDRWERTAIVQGCLRASDTACQVDGETVGLILEETSEDGAMWTAERLRRELEAGSPETTVCLGVGTYPAHALDADQLIAATRGALEAAQRWPGSSVVAAHMP